MSSFTQYSLFLSYSVNVGVCTVLVAFGEFNIEVLSVKFRVSAIICDLQQRLLYHKYNKAACLAMEELCGRPSEAMVMKILTPICLRLLG